MSNPETWSDLGLAPNPGRVESSALEQQLLEEGCWKEKDNGLTIFISNWNHRTFLPRALRSALDALEFLEREGFFADVLVIDGASRDGSQKLLRTVQALYNDSRLKTLCLRQNYTRARLWNLALLTSRFRYVCMMDSDDELVPENLPLFLRTILDTDATMVYGNLIVKEGGDVVDVFSNMTATMRLTKANYVDAFSIVDAEKILRLGGYTRVHPRNPEDWEIILHLIAEEEKMIFVPAVLGYQHRRPLSASEQLKPSRMGATALRRVYAQTGPRGWDDVQVGRMYHPDVGFIDKW